MELELLNEAVKSVLESLPKEVIVPYCLESFKETGKLGAKIRCINIILSRDLSDEKKIKFIKNILDVELD